MFSKLGVSMTILPYLFKTYDEWGDFMWKVCYQARLSWYKYELAFLNRYLSCHFNFDEELGELLVDQQIDLLPILSKAYNLVLSPSSSDRKVRDFLAFAKTLRFRSLNSIKFTSLHNLDIIGVRYAAKFLKFSMPHSINEVYLENGQREIAPYMKSICLLFPRVKDSIVLEKFLITGDELVKVSC